MIPKKSMIYITVLSTILLMGCGGGDSSSTTDNISNDNVNESEEIKKVGSKDNPIKFESDLEEIYNSLSPISTKSEYETEKEYSTRIKNYTDTAEKIYFEIDVSSTYDVETQTLYLYDDSTRDTLSESPGWFGSYYISANNIDSTSYPILSISGDKDEDIRLFYEASVSPEVASMKEDYSNLYKAVIGIKLDPNITFAYSTYSSFSGNLYWVKGMIVYLKVYNRITNEIYTENSFPTDVLERFKRENPVVIDNTYMLMWQDDTISDKMTWDNAKNYCTNLTLNNYNDWYLPNQSELSSLVDIHYASNYGLDYDIPQIYNIFENTANEKYFTSTEYPYGDEAEVISFHNGYDFMSESIFNELRVRCARKLY